MRKPDTMRMHWLKRKRLQDEHVERALNQRRIFVGHAMSPLEDLLEGKQHYDLTSYPRLSSGEP